MGEMLGEGVGVGAGSFESASKLRFKCAFAMISLVMEGSD